MGTLIRGRHDSPGTYNKFTDVKYKTTRKGFKSGIKASEYALTTRGGYVPPAPSDYSKEYLTIEAIKDDCCVYFSNFADFRTAPETGYSCTIEFSTNKRKWYEVTSEYVTYSVPQQTGVTIYYPEPFITLKAGERLYFRGNNETYADGSQSGGSDYQYVISCLPKSANNRSDFRVQEIASDIPEPIFNLSGNIMSLIYGDDFKDKTELPDTNYTFDGLFMMNKYLQSSGNLKLPATSVGLFTYAEMFTYCVNLIESPLILPAATLGRYCYYNMFGWCVSLTTAPELPATTLASNCYNYMFYGCKSLTTAPELPATTLANSCYSSMFRDCISLTTAPLLPATTLAYECYGWMFANCTSLTTAPELPATTLTDYCYASMFMDCTSLTQAPELPATTLANYCYDHMFEYCTRLTQAPELPATTLANSCYSYMFIGCTSLNYIKCLATNISAYRCTYEWVSSVSSTGVFLKEHSMANWHVDSVNGIPSGWTVENFYEPYVTFTANQANSTISLRNISSAQTLEYSINTETWASMTTSRITLANINDKVYVRGILSSDNYTYWYTSFDMSGDISASGYINTLWNYQDVNAPLKGYCGHRLFERCTALTSVNELIFPSITLSDSCYKNMFSGCTNLTNVPILPSTTLADYCYSDMFIGCTSLTTAPELPATTLANDCYYGMFMGCTSLTSAPVLPATTLTTQCYYQMFSGCTSLTTAPELPATTLAQYCYNEMFGGCTSLTTAPELPATTLTDHCYARMFSGCTSLNYIKCLATDISASSCTYNWVNGVASNGTFVKDIYMNDFETGNNGIPSGWTVENFYEPYVTFTANQANSTVGLNKLSSNQTLEYSTNAETWANMTTATTITLANSGNTVYVRGILSANNTEVNYTRFIMTGNISASGNINTLWNYQDVNAQLKGYCGYGLFSGCTALTSVTDLTLPATILTYYCYSHMFDGCIGLSSGLNILPATTLSDSCYEQMFNGCTSLTTTPILPASQLVSNCYSAMFKNCTNLNYIKCLATDISATDCTNGWTSGVSQTGTFVRNPEMIGWSTGVNGIPTGWVIDDFEINAVAFTAIDNSSTIGLNNQGHSAQKLMYTTNYGVTWNPFTTEKTITLNKIGDVVYIRGILSSNNNYNNYTKFLMSGKITAYGNMNTLWNYQNVNAPLKEYCGYYLFSECTALTSVTGLTLPATTLAKSCYSYMFAGCTSLTTAPVLPATTLASYCYNNMFSGCTSLTTAPELPATTLSDRCYYGMFMGCTSLTSAPVLPATTLANYCYSYMFSGCSGLTTAPELPATTLAQSCYWNMFSSCTSLTTAPELPATTLTENCYWNMFSSCTSLTTAPELPATTLTKYCYGRMFENCTSLTQAPVLPATTLVYECYWNMFSGCTNLNYIKCMATDISATDCTKEWVSGVSATGTFVRNPEMYLWRTNVNGIPDNWNIEPKIEINNYIIITANEANSTVGLSNLGSDHELQYSTDAETWIKMNTATTITLINDGDTVFIGGMLFSSNYNYDYTKFKLTGDVSVNGNINALWNYQDVNAELKDYCGYGLFSGCTALTSVSGLTLPANKLSNYCYAYMFRGCTKLISAPTLTATTLAQYCYYFMFDECTGLANAPELPATDMASNCYSCMFRNCTSLTIAPKLLSETLAGSCYSQMFQGCTSLTSAPVLPATTLANYCYSYMFSGCSGLTTAPALPATTLAYSCYSYMFSGCTSLTTAPELPATTLAYYCYQAMFSGCTALTEVSELELPATTLANYCYQGMFSGCMSLTTAPELPATTLTKWCYNSMFSGCTHLNYIKCLATDISATDCTTDWVGGVSTTGTFVKDASMTGWTTGNSGIPNGWTVENIPVSAVKFTAKQANSTIGLNQLNANQVLEYTIDGVNWINMDTATTITLNNIGDAVYIRGILSGPNTHLTGEPVFKMSGNISASGNINTLWNYYDLNASLKNSCGYCFFSKCTALTDISNLTLPSDILSYNCYAYMFSGCTNITQTPVLSATTLANYCYWNMFNGCTSLTSAPELPTTTLANSCYDSMFINCTNLTIAPVLPATTLAERCYFCMFQGCTGLEIAPALPATTLANECYFWMFSGCRSLITIPTVLPATTLRDYCYRDMFKDCTSLTTAPELPATTLAQGCYMGMFAGCTSLTTAPVLSATTLKIFCYEGMFSRCTSLVTAPEIPALIMKQYCYNSMFYGCSNLTTAPELPATTLAESCYRGMFFGCTRLNYIKCLATNISASNCTSNWVSNVSSTGTFIKHPDMEDWTTGSDGIPNGWTVENNPVPLTALSISGETNVTNAETYTIEYTPLDTTETGVTWSIVSGSEYATIDANTGVLTALSGASGSTVIIRATSVVNSGITADKTLSVTMEVPQLLQFTAKQNSSTLGLQRKFSGHTLEYSTDGGSTWTDMTTSTNLTLSNVGDSVYVRGVLSSNQTLSNYTQFKMSGNIKASGNINYLWNKDNPDTTLKNYCGFSLFSGCTALSDVSELELPATALTTYCYGSMFYNCTSLTTAPELPATTLADYCYYEMFYGCTSLTTAPELPATTLTDYCYCHMFDSCTSLTTAPVLPATTLTDHCYWCMFYCCSGLTTAPELPATTMHYRCYAGMFYGCSGLTTAPELPATTLADNCYNSMFDGCTSLTTAPELPATTLANNCYQFMFDGCTSLATAPELPATTLTDHCYYCMFSGCTSLTTAPALPATTLAGECYSHMFDSCGSLTTAPELHATTLAKGCYLCMFYGCTSLNYIKCLATNKSASNCTYNWVNGVASNGTFVKDINMSSWSTGNNGIPNGWTIEDA